LAVVQRAIGDVRVMSAAGPQGHAGTIQRLRAGDRVEVEEAGRAAFELFDGTSIRLAGGTSVLFESANRLELARGILYLDSNPARQAGSIAVDTSFGRVSHVGTQFELRMQQHSLSVRVREGSVVVETPHERLTSKAGEALLITRDRRAERSTMPTSGPEWDWLATIARPFTLEGATVPAFLQWVSREQGWRWEYADAATRRQADGAVLHGSIDGLTPEQALAAVLPASGLTSTRKGDLLIVALGASQ
jgi:hypothetical protein